MSRKAMWMRVFWMLSVLALACTLPARADTSSSTRPVRIQAFTLEAGWHEGRLVKGPDGCTVVDFSAPQSAGARSLALASVDWLEVRRNGAWSTVPVERLLARDPAGCRRLAAAN